MDMMMNMEIIPNWHPILVHFTIALLSVSVALFIAELFVRNRSWHKQLVTVARWNLWLGALSAIATVIAGFYAFNSVPHSSEHQHLAMLDHRVWALSTAALFVLLAIWSFSATLRGKADFKKKTNLIFVGLMTVAGLMLATTGYKGAELVYRHGLGVIPMQMNMAGGHNHSHGGHDHAGHDHGAETPEPSGGHDESSEHDHNGMPDMEMPDMEESGHDHGAHKH
ncbi:MAG: hypothetical protein CO093_02115 [Alphaproteobacteria bacterium CG_4_9_14_3_um_filter_47_13]|nr:MAG: hypothetical protein CO093_02115 [Alphaproteobacteria bacterium CG_4_9_14_3_um_filter_47_13]